MAGIFIARITDLVDVIGDTRTKGLISDFSCPRNQDVEMFLKEKAVLFSEHGYSQTHLVLMSYKSSP